MDKKELVNQSIDYIMQHLNEEISLDTLAAQFYISKYYFSRIFKEETRESIYAFIKRCKVDQSAIDMKLDPTKSITDIGLEYGYSSSNYSSVFKKHHEIPPSIFKQSISATSMTIPFQPDRIVSFKTADAYAEKIEVHELDDLFMLYERYIGNYIEIEKHWQQFLAKNKDVLDDKTLLVERFYHDPSITNPTQCICDICMTVSRDCELSNTVCISGGTWAVYHFDGEIKDIFETLQGVFSIWLPQSGYNMTRRYGLNIYRHIDWDKHRVVMDLYIPVS